MSKVKKLDLLVALYIGCLVTAELMGGKIFTITDKIQLFGKPLAASVAIFLVPILFSINDVVAEVHGKERARSIIRSGLFVIAGLAAFSAFATLLPASSRSPVANDTYNTVFHTSARISLASLIAFVTSEFLDVAIFVKVRKLFGTGKLWLRNNASNFISQLIDTSVFIFFAFYNLNEPNIGFLITIIVPYWLLKCFMSIIETPFVYLGVKWLKKGE